MIKKYWVLSIFLALTALPALAHASVAVVQDSCNTTTSPTGKVTVHVFFSVVNFDNVNNICDVHFRPEGTPPDPGCIITGCTTPAGWSCATNATGGADYTASSSGGCISAGHILRGFQFTLDPEYCCYAVDFTDANSQVFATTEACFSCVKVDAQQKPWGGVKQLYR